MQQMEIEEPNQVGHGGKTSRQSRFWKKVGLELPLYTPEPNKLASILNILRYLGLLGVLVYIIILLAVEKGYQKVSDNIVSVTQTKVKGVSFVESPVLIPGISNRTWDIPDHVVPPQENDAFFVTTNAIVTPGQRQGICDEDPTIQDARCRTDHDCPPGVPVLNGNGVRTGKCIVSTQDPLTGVCEVHAWCPVAINKLPIPGKAIFEAAENFTVLIKNWIEFPEFEIKRRNIIEEINNDDYLDSCHYNKNDLLDRYCPVFRLGTIVQEAGSNFTQMAVQGGVIAIEIIWNCDLDKGDSECDPSYQFRRLDSNTTQISPGWNFRHARYYREDGVDKRDLVKAYGIRFAIETTGKAGKFHWETMMVDTIGSTLGYFSIPGAILLLMMQYLKKTSVYKRYNHVQDV